ncbi:hypothetical protein H4S14_004174 [Agrobacterium vitis]|nr:hypothetical protein [Agrobacterium vitis]MBE1440400.1 hypothetical protein [Agrobacterium vitis]
MAQAYFSLVTHAGRIKLAQSAAGGDPVTITHFAVGDGNGADTNPTANSTALVREVWRTQVESVATDPDNPSAILVTAIIPTNAGGWWMREFGIFDKSGTMIAVARPVSQYKPTALEGQLEDIRYEFQIIIGEAANVTLLVDPSLIFATRDWVQTRKIPMAQMNRLPWLPVVSMTLTAPPANVVQGEAYLVPSNASGLWAGKGGMIAEWVGTAWFYSTPTDGHGVSLPDGRVFMRIAGQYVELLASEIRAGLVELATVAEALAGKDPSKAVTPVGLLAVMTKALASKADLTMTATETTSGLVELATIPETVAGTDTARATTPAGVAAAITAAITKVINGSPAALDTLLELAAALGNDANFATTMTNALAKKLNLTGGTITGNVKIERAAPRLSLHYPDIKVSWGVLTGDDGRLYFYNEGGAENAHSFATSGAIWTKQLGDVKTYIDQRVSRSELAGLVGQQISKYAPQVVTQQTFHTNTTASIQLWLTTPCPGVLVAIGTTNYSSVNSAGNASSLSINGVQLATDHTVLTRAHSVAAACGTGVQYATLQGAAGVDFALNLTLIFIPNPGT